MVMKNEKREIGVESLVTNNSAARQRGNFREDTSYPSILSYPCVRIPRFANAKEREIMSYFSGRDVITVFNFVVSLDDKSGKSCKILRNILQSFQKT